MSPVDRVHQVLVAVSSRPSPHRGGEVEVAVRVGTSRYPEAQLAETDRAGTGSGRQSPPFQTPREFALPPPPSIEHGAGSGAIAAEDDAHIALPIEDDGPEWVSVSTAPSPPLAARKSAALPAAAVEAQSMQGLQAMRQTLAHHRGREAYESAGFEPGASAPVRPPPGGSSASRGFHTIA